MPKKQAKHPPNVDMSVSHVNRKVAISLVQKGYAISFAGPNKECIVTGWQDNPVRTVAEVNKFYDEKPHAVPMIPTGKLNDVTVLDIDKKNGRDGFAGFAAIGEDPKRHAKFIVRTPNDGIHIYFSSGPGIGSTNRHLPKGVDIRGGYDDGRPSGYVIAPGAIVADGMYEVSKGELLDTCIGFDPLPDRFRPDKILNQDRTVEAEIDFEEVSVALAFIPNDERNDGANSRDYWIAIGAALHHASGGSEVGRLAFLDWSAQHVSFDADHTDNAWNSFGRKDGAVATSGTIFFEARKFGWGKVDLEAMLDEIDGEDHKALGESKGCKIQTYTPAECAQIPHVDYLVKGLLAPGDLFCIFGEPGAGKSMLAPYIAYQLAQGESVFGLRSNQGKGLYVAAEDAAGMRNRISALRNIHGDTTQFLLAAGVSDLFTPGSEDLKELCRIAKRENPALIVIDTLAMAFGSMEENSQEAMVHVVNVSRLLSRDGAAVVLVHHGTKADGGTPRGHSALNGALDGSMQLKPKDKAGVVRGILKKNRRGSIDLDIAFRIEAIELGRDQDDDPIMGPHAKFLDSGAPGRERLTAGQKAALNILKNLTVDLNSISAKCWKSACMHDDSGISESEKIDSRRKAASNAMKALEEKGYVSNDSGLVCVVGRREEYLFALIDELAEEAEQVLPKIAKAA